MKGVDSFRVESLYMIDIVIVVIKIVDYRRYRTPLLNSNFQYTA